MSNRSFETLFASMSSLEKIAFLLFAHGHGASRKPLPSKNDLRDWSGLPEAEIWPAIQALESNGRLVIYDAKAPLSYKLIPWW